MDGHSGDLEFRSCECAGCLSAENVKEFVNLRQVSSIIAEECMKSQRQIKRDLSARNAIKVSRKYPS